MLEQELTAQSEAQIPEEEVHHESFFDATFFVAVGFFVFIGILIWKKVPAMIGGALDSKAGEIEQQLENARTLREEANKLLASYQRQQRQAEQRAEDMLEQAESEARLLGSEAEAKITEMVERRTRLAEQKIAQAEAVAVKEIQRVAADVATSAARRLIAENLKKADRDALIKTSIDKLDSRLH